ncbi:MAG: right-handed parallel beta-helix repeat-containing protein, partial [Actinomycetota bacterium]
RRASTSAVVIFGLLLAGLIEIASAPAAEAGRRCRGVPVRPGDPIHAMVRARPRGARFCFFNATYRLTTSIQPKQGQRFVGRGALLTGGGRVGSAFDNHATGVRIKRFEIRYFHTGIDAAKGWRIRRVNAHHNKNVGIHLVGNSLIAHSRVHHNRLGGIGAFGPNIRIRRNVIAYNHRVRGGTCSGKFSRTSNLVVKYNNVHHNRCPALWADVSSHSPLFARNRVVRNHSIGIDCEISFDCVIRGNLVRGNSSGIMVSSTKGAQVRNNRVVANPERGIVITQQGTATGIRRDHPSRHGPHRTTNNIVARNVIRARSGYSGVRKYGAVGWTVYSDWANNRFFRNRYRMRIGRRAEYFKWRARNVRWRDWRRAGHDRGGSFRKLR